MFRRNMVFRDEGDAGGSADLAGDGSTNGTNVEKTGWTSAVKDSIFKEHGEELAKHENINSVLEDYFTQKGKLSTMEVPKDVKEYEFEVPEGATKNEDFDAVFREMSLKANLSKQSAKEMYSGFKSLEASGLKAQAEAKEKALADATKAMKAEYGDDYDSVVAKSARVIELGGEDFKKSLNESGLGNDPRMIKAIAAIGNLISEDSLISGKQTQQKAEKTLAERIYGKKE